MPCMTCWAISYPVCSDGILVRTVSFLKLFTFRKASPQEGGRDCGLAPHELLLWSSLAFRILTYEELRAEFYEERELHTYWGWILTTI